MRGIVNSLKYEYGEGIRSIFKSVDGLSIEKSDCQRVNKFES